MTRCPYSGGSYYNSYSYYSEPSPYSCSSSYEARTVYNSEPPVAVENSCGNSGFLIEHDVPEADHEDLKEIGYSFWLRGSFISPGPMDFRDL